MTQYHCRLLAKTGTDTITIGFNQKPTMMTQYQCQLVLSLTVLAKDRQPGDTITAGFLKPVVTEPTVNIRSAVVV
jgi:hypothetical protein